MKWVANVWVNGWAGLFRCSMWNKPFSGNAQLLRAGVVAAYLQCFHKFRVITNSLGSEQKQLFLKSLQRTMKKKTLNWPTFLLHLNIMLVSPSLPIADYRKSLIAWWVGYPLIMLLIHFEKIQCISISFQTSLSPFTKQMNLEISWPSKIL